jgi:hypothetical protein
MKRLFRFLFIITFLLACDIIAYAKSGDLTAFNNTYGTSATKLNTCLLCHPVVPSLNSYGNAYKNNGCSFKNIEPLDSDGDGYSSIAEINARTFPGDPASKPNSIDTVAPAVTAFSIPSISSSLTVPITTFAATDNIKVTGYLLTETSVKPLASAGGWSVSARQAIPLQVQVQRPCMHGQKMQQVMYRQVLMTQ